MKRLYKDRWNKKIGGVLGGLGQYLKVDPTILRLAYVYLTILTGILPLLVLYIVAWMIMPDGPKLFVEPKYRQLYRSRKNRKIAGICGGLSALTRIDANVLRLVMVIACILTGGFPLIIAYIVGILLIPQRPISHSHSR